ncbi:hypothetical protein LWC34_23560 [Kibdelosporangium philippinense]|uniref:Lipoprotein n=1 Tax=Kibdelosporangium philippinense TaxID=211113 RepID=A0ABS8ZEA1_9PSEU|nr:hypothetical protein [Kibdelosporangium philippinense]MCE7005782.1 hypothetical protein [Kibdelosporangium philippinense]
MRITRLVLLAVLLVAGCGQSVAGSPVPNSEAAKKSAERLYNQGISAISGYFTNVNNFRGSLFFYAAVNDRKSGSDIDVAMRGAPGEQYSLMTKHRSKTPPGYDYDVYSPAGSALDYVRLGKAYTSIAPTPWVSLPTISDGYVCAISGLQTLCKLVDALRAVDKAPPPGRITTASRLPDGRTEVRTEITLKAFIDNRVIGMPADVAGLIEPEMMSKLVPLKIMLSSDGALQGVEVKGAVQGTKSRVELEVGYEARGTAVPADFPPQPQAGDVTALPDETARSDFWKRMAAAQK